MTGKILAVHQPNFLPWAGYFRKLANADVFVILDDVQFAKRSYINRTQVNLRGETKWMTVPVLTKGRFTQPIHEVLIDPSFSGSTIFETLRHAYSKAPHAHETLNALAPILNGSWEKLLDLNMALLHACQNLLGLSVELSLSSSHQLDSDPSGRIIELCRIHGATTYLSGSGGMAYNDLERFQSEGLSIEQLEPPSLEFNHISGHLIEGLSLVDSLVHLGPATLKSLIMRDER